jgi:hypothetical protein
VENKFHGQGKYIWEHGAYYIGAWYSPAPYVCIHMCVLVLAVTLLMLNWLNCVHACVSICCRASFPFKSTAFDCCACPFFFHSFLSFSFLTLNAIREGNKMHGDGMFVDSVGRQWKGKFYNGQGPGLHTLPANDAPETDLNKTPVAHQPSGKSAKSAGSAA